MALIDKASLLMVPSTYEAGKLYNVLPSGNRAPDSTGSHSGYDQTRADFSFDRGTNAAATRVNADGLIEKYRENLLTYSNDFSNGVWAKSNLSVASSNGAWEVTDNTTSGSHYLYWGGTTPSSSVLTLSVEAKAGSVNYLVMRLGGFTYAYFNVANGTLGTIHSSFIDAKIEETSDGFYRCSATILTPSSGNASVFYPSDNSSNVSYTGTGAVAITIKNAQLESGLVSTDYLDSTSVTGKAGVLIDLPRIDYSSGAGALLLEPSRQQLYQYSEYSGAWNKTNWTTTDNYAISPEGVKNAFRAVSSNTSGILYVSGTGVTGQKNTLSVWAKSNTGSDQKFRFFTDGNTNTSSDFTATTEWQRFEHTYDCAFVTAGIKGASSELSDILFYGFQHEAGSYSTSYIPNHGESGGVTRAADLCTGGGSAESINSTEGVLYAEISALADDLTYRIFSINDGTTNERVYIQYTNANDTISVVVKNANTTQANISHSLTDETQNTKVAFRYKANDFAFYVNGSQVGTDTSGSTPVGLNNFSFDQGNGANFFYGNVKQVAVFNEALTNEELATLTTL